MKGADIENDPNITMHIANPLYDVVFKYLMEDGRVAKLILSTIIGEEILALELRPQERIVELEKRSLTVYRLDFVAQVKTETGAKTVIIEVQKAKFAADIMRFRRYLGEQYRDKENSYRDPATQKEKATPIISIYFLGYSLEHTTAPVIRVNRRYIDGITGEEIHEREEFIESLTHESVVIQIPHLRQKRRSDLEVLLSLFDQTRATRDQQLLNINEEDYPEKYRRVIRRLQKAALEPELRDIMEVEEDVLQDYQDIERNFQILEQEMARKTQLVQENERIIQDNERTIQEKERSIQQRDQEIGRLKLDADCREQEMQARDEIIQSQESRLLELEAIVRELQKK